MKPLFFIKILVLATLLASCASRYRQIRPTTLKFDQIADTLKNGHIVFSWKEELLRKTGNRKYARQERRHDVRLLAVRVANFSNDTLFLPENLSVFAEKDTLELLDADAAYNALRQNIADDPLESDDSDWGWLIALGIDQFNWWKQKKANSRFSDELDKFYLTPCFVAPGKTTVGLLALPMKKKKPLRFGLRGWKH